MFGSGMIGPRATDWAQDDEVRGHETQTFVVPQGKPGHRCTATGRIGRDTGGRVAQRNEEWNRGETEER